jgi:radical SAM-linked protein
MIRIRLTYAKIGWLKYTSNLDVQKIWERALRRARLPLAYSQGFNPQPRMNLAAPLPLGFTGSAELVDIWFTDDQLTVAEIQDRLPPMLPPGIKIENAKPVALSEASLQSQVSAAEYRIRLVPDQTPDDLAVRVSDLMKSAEIIRTRRGKEYDLRPLIEDLHILGDGQLAARLTMLPKATGRPEELLEAMRIDPNDARIERTSLILAA